MRKAVETPKPENPFSPVRFERVLLVGTGLRGWHYGQRRCEAASTGRTHGSTDLKRRTSKKLLPNGSRPHMAKPRRAPLIRSWPFSGPNQTGADVLSAVR